jgi:adenylate cyclase class IV
MTRNVEMGTFIELEVVLTKSQADSDGERIASELMDRLGVRQEDLIEQAYVDLLVMDPDRRDASKHERSNSRALV